MSTKSIVISSIILIAIFILLFFAGYERGSYKAHKEDAEVASANAMKAKESEKSANELEKGGVSGILAKASEALPDSISLTKKNAAIASNLIDTDDNDIADDINFEFNKTASIIAADNAEGERYTIDTLAERIMQNKSEFDPAELDKIKTEIFVYVGMFDEPNAVSAAEFLERAGFPPRIQHVPFNNRVYTFVIAGPLLLKDDAERLLQYLHKNGYKEARIIE